MIFEIAYQYSVIRDFANNWARDELLSSSPTCFFIDVKRASWYGGFYERLIGLTKTAIKKAASSIYSEINHGFKELYNVEFSSALAMLPDLQIETKNSKHECKVENRKRKMAFRDSTQEHFNSVDSSSFLGTRQSYNQRSKQRKILFFESDDDAKKRVEERIDKENTGERKRKRHSPSWLW